jgi:hypothetical protein
VGPVIYAGYTADGTFVFNLGTHSGRLTEIHQDSPIFNDSIRAYKSWVLFAVFSSIIVSLLSQERRMYSMKASFVKNGNGVENQDHDMDAEESHALRNVDLETEKSATQLAWTIAEENDDKDYDVYSGGRLHSPCLWLSCACSRRETVDSACNEIVVLAKSTIQVSKPWPWMFASMQCTRDTGNIWTIEIYTIFSA